MLIYKPRHLLHWPWHQKPITVDGFLALTIGSGYIPADNGQQWSSLLFHSLCVRALLLSFHEPFLHLWCKQWARLLTVRPVSDMFCPMGSRYDSDIQTRHTKDWDHALYKTGNTNNLSISLLHHTSFTMGMTSECTVISFSPPPLRWQHCIQGQIQELQRGRFKVAWQAGTPKVCHHL